MIRYEKGIKHGVELRGRDDFWPRKGIVEGLLKEASLPTQRKFECLLPCTLFPFLVHGLAAHSFATFLGVIPSSPIQPSILNSAKFIP